jgi:predicted phage terminase large subunit-like protein
VHAVELPEKFDDMIQSWDCAFKDLQTSSFVVGQVMSKLGTNRYLVDQVRDRMDMPSTVQAIRAMTAKYPNCGAKLVEDKANGTAVIQSLQSEITGLIGVNPQGGKMSRAAAVSPEVQAGNWFLPHPGLFLWVQDFIEECASFPTGAHDDQVDAWTQGANYLRPRIPQPNIRFFDIPGPSGMGRLETACTRGWR